MVDDVSEIGLETRIRLFQNVEELNADEGSVGNVDGVVGVLDCVELEVVILIHQSLRLVLESEDVIDFHHILVGLGELIGNLGQFGCEIAGENLLDFVPHLSRIHYHLEVFKAHHHRYDLVLAVTPENCLDCVLQLLFGDVLELYFEGLEEVLKGLFLAIILVVQVYEVILQ